MIEHEKSMFGLARELWPINRSLSGTGVRESLAVISKKLPTLRVKKFETGSKKFDWEVPDEWNVSEAYIIAPNGQKICDYSENNLHLVGYSEPVEGAFTLEELQKYLYSLPDQPSAIPYVTSYYKRTWGFCITENERAELKDGNYTVVIRSEFTKRGLDYGELVIPGTSSREIFFSTYLCHPSMANNELSGPVLATELATMLQGQENYYTYRFIFIPETIGSISYMAENLEQMKNEMLAGFVLTCVGDERAFSYLPSRKGKTVADQVALQALEELEIEAIHYDWKDRGSDERQYCSPGADLPVCSVMRSKYGEYPEYHTSLDTLGAVVTEAGLKGSFDVYARIIGILEGQRYPRMELVGEPQLGKRGLYPNTSIKGAYSDVSGFMDLLSTLDGTVEVADAARSANLDPATADSFLKRLEQEGLVRY